MARTLVEVTLLDTGETILVPCDTGYGDFTIELNGDTIIVELERANALKDAGALVEVTPDHSDAITLEDLFGDDYSDYA